VELDLAKLARVEAGVAALESRLDRLARARADAWDESKHPRSADGKFGSGGGSLSNNDWQTWAASGYDVNEALRGNLKAGQRDATGEKLTDDDVANLKRIGSEIQAAAENGRIPGGVTVYRGMSFASEADMKAALGGRSLELGELTSTGTSPDVAMEYARHWSSTFDHPVQAVVEFSSGNGMPGVESDPIGAGSEEYVLPKGARFTSMRYAGKNADGAHVFKAYTSGSKKPPAKKAP